MITSYTHYDTARGFLATGHRQCLIKWLSSVVIYTAHNDLRIQLRITGVLLAFNSEYLKRLEVFYTQLFKVNEQYIPRTLQEPKGNDRSDVMWPIKSASNNSGWTRSYPKHPATRQRVNMLLTHQETSKAGRDQETDGVLQLQRERGAKQCVRKERSGASGSGPAPCPKGTS